jgi:hypothetical protein
MLHFRTKKRLTWTRTLVTFAFDNAFDNALLDLDDPQQWNNMSRSSHHADHDLDYF